MSRTKRLTRAKARARMQRMKTVERLLRQGKHGQAMLVSGGLLTKGQRKAFIKALIAP